MTEHFTIDEFTFSEAAVRSGLDNTPPAELLPAAHRTLEGLERIRALIRVPIIITSGYRSPKVNAAVGGSEHSQHMRCEAADIISPSFGTPMELAQHILKNAGAVQFDQLILEFGHWVHVSFAKFPRCSVLTIHNRHEGYQRGLV